MYDRWMRRNRDGSSAPSRLDIVCCFRCFLPSETQSHIVVLGFRVIEFSHRNDEDAGPVANRNPVEILQRRAGGCGKVVRRNWHGRQLSRKPLVRALQCGVETVGADWFQEVVHSVNFERPNRESIVRGNEHHGPVRANQLQHFKTVELRHLDIEEQQIGFELCGKFDCLEAVRAFGDDFNVCMGGNVLAKNLPCEVFVVHNHRANFLAPFVGQGFVPFLPRED